MTIDLVREFTENISSHASSVAYGRGQLLAVPWTVGYDESVQIYVEQIADDLYLLTDRGMAADSLADFDIDLSKPAMLRSWQATIRHGHLEPAMLVDTHEYEIATTVTREKIGDALASLGQTIVRTDGLRGLARRRSETFRERAMIRAHDLGLTVVPRPVIPGQFVRRNVSFGVEIDDRVESFIETISGREGLAEIDTARAIFGDALTVSTPKKVALISSAARMKGWPIEETLNGIAVVVDEADQDEFFGSLAA